MKHEFKIIYEDGDDCDHNFCTGHGRKFAVCSCGFKVLLRINNDINLLFQLNHILAEAGLGKLAI